MSRSGNLIRHGELTTELAYALRELGDLNAEVTRTRSATWRSTDHLNVTERRETCREASATVDIEIAKLTGDIEALRAELNHIEYELNHADPNPDTGTEYIEISDFSPGVHSDFHASQAPRYTAAADTQGALPGNGIARVDGTERCHADKTGALVPLPKMQATGSRDTIYPTLDFQVSRPYRYVLDAQVGPTLIDSTEVEVVPHLESSRQMLQIMWGMYLIPES